MAATQFAPPSVDRYTPASLVPTKRTVSPEPPKAGEVQIALTPELGSPELTIDQISPLLVERKTLPLVPAKRFGPLTASERTGPPLGPLVCTHWACVPVYKRIKSINCIFMRNKVFMM